MPLFFSVKTAARTSVSLKSENPMAHSPHDRQPPCQGACSLSKVKLWQEHHQQQQQQHKQQHQQQQQKQQQQQHHQQQQQQQQQQQPS